MPFAAGTGVGLVGAFMAFHSGLGNPDVGRNTDIMLVSDKLAATCYSDDTLSTCAARVAEAAGEVTEKITSLKVSDVQFLADFQKIGGRYHRALADVLVMLARDGLSAEDKLYLGFSRDTLMQVWSAKVKEGVDKKVLPSALLQPADVASN